MRLLFSHLQPDNTDRKRVYGAPRFGAGAFDKSSRCLHENALFGLRKKAKIV